MREARDGAVRFVVPAALADCVEENLFEWFDDVPFTAARGAAGELSIWVSPSHAAELEAAFRRHGSLANLSFEEVSRVPEAPRDWVAEAAALQKSVVVGRYLLDPHDGELSTKPRRGQRRLWLPATRAFGTGSHESTRLGIRLLLEHPLAGRSALDVGCGTGTLAFVAALEGAAAAVAFDTDLDAAFATREQAIANRVPRLAVFAGPVEGLRADARFDVVVANMILEEVAPLLPAIRTRLAPGGRLLSSGLLVERRREWEDLLQGNGFRIVGVMTENEWLGTASERVE